ncbi:MAG: hypothetical protein ACT4O4_00395, partial [Nitrospiraceae bacterium]
MQLETFQLPRMFVVLSCLLVLAAAGGCKGLPTLEQQESLVRANNLVLDHITTRAVVNAWGEPPHLRSEFTQFFVMSDLSLIPRSRVAVGEAPKGWNSGVHAGEGVYFAYPDRGWLLVFLDERLVYKEELKAEQMQALVKAWAYEDRFKTRLDTTPAP